MACKNLYKGKWYTDQELIDLLLQNDKIAEEIVNNPKFKEDAEEQQGGVKEGGELQDGKEAEEEKVKPSRFGLRYFTELSKVPKETQREIEKSGVTNYKTTSLKEADDIATEIVANNTTEDLTKMIVDDVDMNNALWVAIATKTQQKLDREIYAAKKKGEDTTEMVNNQLSIVKRVTADVSAAGLLLRAVQAGFVTDYLAPITWVKAYIDAVKNKKAESEKSKWLKRSLATFESKIKKATEKSVNQTLEKAKKETERAEKKLNKEPKKEVSKVDSIMREWQKAINKRRGGVLFQAAKKEFEWTEEDIDFATQVVNAYIESGIYARPVLEKKIRNKFAKFGITINDSVLERIIPKEFGGKTLESLFEEQQLDEAAEALASRIFGEVIDKEAKPTDPMKIMVNTLLGKFREREKAPAKEKKSAMENIVAAIRGVKEYEQVWTEARDLAIDKINELDINEFEKELAVEKINNAYDKATKFTFTENQVKSVVRKYIRDNQIKMSDIVRSHLSIRNATRESIKKGIIAMSGLDEKEADILAKSISDIWERTLKDNSKSIVDRETKRMKDKIAGITRTTVQKTDVERLLDMIILGAFEDVEFRDAYSAVKGIPKLDAKVAAKIESLAEAVRVTPSTTVKRMRKQDLLMYMRQIDGVELGELADTIWYGFILGNVPTQIRNTVGAFGNTYGVLLAEALTNPLKIPQILRSQKRGGQMGLEKAGVILRTGKQFFENVTDMPAFSEYAREKGGGGIFKYIAYLMRWMSANDQTSMSIGKESFAALLAEEHLKVNRFKKAYDPKYRKAINEAVDKLLSITPEQVKEIERIVEDEAAEFDYTADEKIVRKQELIDEARPKDLLMEAEKAASRATGNTKAYGTLAQVIDKITWLPRNFEIPIPYKGKKYSFRPFKMLATFTRISTAIANLQLGFTPIGFFNVLWNKHGFFKDSNFNAEMTPAERKQMLQRATFGTLTIALLYALVNPDDDDHWLTITANGTGNYKDNEELRNSGKWRPYSIYLGGMDGTRVSYRYSPFSLMLATVGYMSDRKKYVKKHKDTPDIELLLQAMLWYPPFLSETTPLGTSIKFLGDVFGGVGYGESKIDPEKMVKTLANTAKGYYAPSIFRDIADFYDYAAKDYKAENNELYNSMIDRTPIDLLPLPKEDRFPMRDAWGLPVERINSIDEFVGIGKGDVYSDLIRYHWENSGVLGKPQRDGLFELWYSDGGMQAGQLTRKHVETRELWNEVYLKNRGEYLREAVLQLKSEGLKGEEYIKEFEKLKAEANERAKEDVFEYTLLKPLDKKYKEDK